MSSRWLERSFTDTMHETLTFAWLPIIFAAVALAAVADQGWFRLYSLATVLVLMGFGAASGLAIQGLEENDTPWAGVFERINAYALMAWFVVLAVTVMRRPLRAQTSETPVTARRRGSKTREPSLAATSRVRVAALLLIAGLVAGPVSTHVYWMLGGTWGLYSPGTREEVATTGMRVVAAVVVVLLVAALLVVLARVGLWQQAFVSERMIRFFAWALAAVFLVETVAAFTWSREHEWWLYGPVSLMLGLLALVVARSGGAWPRFHRPYRTLPSH